MNKLDEFYKKENEKIKNKEDPTNNLQVTFVDVKKVISDYLKDNLPEYPTKEEIIEALTEVVKSIKPPVHNHPDIQKVEVQNQTRPPVINVTEKQIKFPKIQKVIGEVRDVKKSIDSLHEKLVELKPPGILEISNLPITRFLDAKDKKQKALPVKVINKEFLVSAGGTGTLNTDNRTFIREEYTYTTVSGIQVPTTVKKWTHNGILTENYEYDENANPIVKSRSFESSSGQVGS